MDKLLDRKKIREERQGEIERKEQWEKVLKEKKRWLDRVMVVAKRSWQEKVEIKVKEFEKNYPKFQKKIKDKVENWADKTNTRIDDILLDCKERIWELRYLGLMILILVLGLINIRSQYFRFPEDEFSQKLERLNFYPKASNLKLDLAKYVFERGNKEIALSLLSEAEQDLAWLNKVGLNSVVERKISKVSDYLKIPQKKEMYLVELEKEITTLPYSWQLLYKKAEIEAELFKQEELKKTLALIKWLNPSLENLENQFQ